MNAILLGLYLSVGTAYVDPAPTPSSHAYGQTKNDLGGYHSPYGIVALGWSGEVSRRFSVNLEARHMSSIPGRDWGTNSAEVRVTWRPFR
jgi:hypothetical protein